MTVHSQFFDENDPLIRFLNEDAIMILSMIPDIRPYLKTLETLTVQSVHDIVTEVDLELGYSCWRYEKMDIKFNNRKMYAFQITINTSNKILERIEFVTYKLPAPWPNPVRKVTDRITRFALKELAWGSSRVPIYADVKIRGQDPIVSLSHPIDLTECH